jgi:hypothetical protein
MAKRTEHHIERILRQAMPRINDVELRRDLWPSMLRRLEEQHPAPGWLDWALMGLLAAALVAVPQTFPVLLYFL